MGAARCPLLRLRRSRLASAWGVQTGRIRPGRENAMTPELTSPPRLAVGCRLNEKSQPSRVLHMPERALRLNGPSLEIVERCDGSRTVQEIISELQKLYSKAEPKKVETDILGYLALLHDQRALDFVSDEANRSADAR